MVWTHMVWTHMDPHPHTVRTHMVWTTMVWYGHIWYGPQWYGICIQAMPAWHDNWSEGCVLNPIWLNFTECLEYYCRTRTYRAGRLRESQARIVIANLPREWNVHEAARPESEGIGWLYAVTLSPRGWSPRRGRSRSPRRRGTPTSHMVCVLVWRRNLSQF